PHRKPKISPPDDEIFANLATDIFKGRNFSSLLHFEVIFGLSVKFLDYAEKKHGTFTLILYRSIVTLPNRTETQTQIS
ncbi:MAG: hypothetical protein IJV54_06055, partial [Bacteroidales bacterium]|nr:hypothetical protein [Bacteroidales bacterium]